MPVPGGFLSMASACSGISGRDQASGAGDRSSVLVSPVTLKIVIFHRSRHFGAAGEPFGVGPRLHHGLGVGAAFVGEFLDVVGSSRTSAGFLEPLGGDSANLGVVDQVDQRFDVEPAQHRADSSGGLWRTNTSAHFSSPLAPCQENCLDLGGVIHAGTR